MEENSKVEDDTPGMETIQISAAGATTKKEAAGEVQEKPAAARGGVVDADCQRVSDASALPLGTGTDQRECVRQRSGRA